MNHSHVREILPTRGSLVPIPGNGKLFSFNYGLWGTGGGNIYYPEEGHVTTLIPGQGKFWGAVAIDDSTTNILSNPFFDNDLSGWSRQNSSGGNSVTVTSGGDLGLGKVVRIYSGGVGSRPAIYQGTSGVDLGQQVTVSVRARLYSGDGRIRLRWGSTDSSSGQVFNIGYQWSTLVWVTEKDGNGNIIIELTDTSIEYGCEIDAVQVEIKPYATSFVDGSRPSGRLVYPKIIPPVEGTIIFWNKIMTHPINTNHTPIFDSSNIEGRPFFLAWRPSTSGLHCRVRGHSITGPEGEGLDWSGKWYFYAISYNENWVTVYRSNDSGNLQKVYDKALQPTSFEPITIHLGTDQNFSRASHNMFSDLLVLPYVAPEEEVRAIFESDAPLYDPHTRVLVAL